MSKNKPRNYYPSLSPETQKYIHESLLVQMKKNRKEMRQYLKSVGYKDKDIRFALPQLYDK